LPPTTTALAHIAGVPLEETALSLAPVATVFGSAALLHLKRGASRRATTMKRPAPRTGGEQVREVRR
jgi:hypothetical protein